jgi:transcriptional regulator with XRE-family HTH domain
MTDLSYNNWYVMTDKALTKQIGAFVKHHRMEQNKTQDAFANAAGISRSTLSLLERGETVSLDTLIRVLRMLKQLHIFEAFVIHNTISPLLLAKIELNKRKRARGKSGNNAKEIGK